MTLLASGPVQASPLRDSAVVRAVRKARPSVVNIHGQKVVRADDYYAKEATKRVNGMGSGVVIDGRGFVLTNFHVVDGVKRIRVTLGNGQAYTARLIAHDPGTDLAIIKLPIRTALPPITVGSSRDIMTGETVIAVGNAYGYEHTVTTGIVSAQHRNVQVNDAQNYYDLIQTDASINPGNSGGPLLNVDGEMIGLNVAVRVGAQGIGFAIPVDRAMQVAARLMTVERISGLWHGVIPEDIVMNNEPTVIVKDVKIGSPAHEAGIREGDVIRRVAGRSIQRSLDVERVLLGSTTGEAVKFAFDRANQSMAVDVALATYPGASTTAPKHDLPWSVLGIRIQPAEDLAESAEQFRGGLRVKDLDPRGVASQAGVARGDILVGIHIWETASVENLQYILTQSDFEGAEEVPFYVLRKGETLAGSFRVSQLQ